jgi:hypothetical protein
MQDADGASSLLRGHRPDGALTRMRLPRRTVSAKTDDALAGLRVRTPVGAWKTLPEVRYNHPRWWAPCGYAYP